MENLTVTDFSFPETIMPGETTHGLPLGSLSIAPHRLNRCQTGRFLSLGLSHASS